jgi:hypothetical protein
MTARQTIIHVRGGRTDLSAEVASLLPSAAARGRSAAKKATSAKTTFCPICGGNKLKDSARCGSCRDAAVRRVGHRTGASRSLLGEAIARDNPNPGDPKVDGPTWSHRAKGDGAVRVQPWERKVLVDGKWMRESDTPDGQERRETDDEAVRRLRGALR